MIKFSRVSLLGRSHSECEKGRMTMQINYPSFTNLRYIKVHSEGQAVCMDPNGFNCGNNGAVDPCSSVPCNNGGKCNPLTAECECPEGFSGALCEKKN